MRKNLLNVLGVAAFSLVAQSSLAQTLLFEDFQNGMPGSFLLYDVDGLTPAGGVNYMTAAWIARVDYPPAASTDSVAVSTSWYNPAGTSDDWMVTPAVVLGNDAVLEWDAKAQDPAYPDGYEVYVGTDDNPTGLMTNAPIFSVPAESPTWVHHSMSLTAYNGQTIHVGFRNNSTDMFILIVDNIKISIAAAFDGGVSKIVAPVSDCTTNSAAAVTVRIMNFGATAISNFPVSMQLNGGTAVAETVAGPINPGDSLDYTFTATANLGTNADYTINAYTTVTADGNPANDMITSTIHSGPYSVIPSFGMGFEAGEDLSAWTIEDVDGDGMTFDLPGSLAHTGANCLRAAISGTMSASPDNWIYTPCLDLQAGTNYSLEYFYKVFDVASVSYSIESKIGTAPANASMTQTIVSDPTPADTTYQQSLHTFSVPAAGVYYIGFHVYGTSVQNSFRLDDINVTVATGINNVESNSGLVSVYPSPASNDLNIRLDQTISDATVEVYNSLGALVKTIYNAQGVVKVDVSTYAKGIYTLKVLANDKVLSQRFSIVK